MRRYLIVLSILAVAGLAGAAAFVADDKETEEQVKLDQLPSLVKTTLLKEAGDGKIVEIEKVTKAGVTTYEADVVINKATWELRIAENGKLISKKLDDEDDDGPDDDDDDDDQDDD